MLFLACVFALGVLVMFDLQSNQNISKQNQAIVKSTNEIVKVNNKLLDVNTKAIQRDDSLSYEILENQKVIIKLLKKK